MFDAALPAISTAACAVGAIASITKVMNTQAKITIFVFGLLGLAFSGAFIACVRNISKPNWLAYLQAVRNDFFYFLLGMIPATVQCVSQTVANLLQIFVPDKLVTCQKVYVIR